MIIILLGPPGAGKGTIAGEIKKEKDIPIISTGDILRKAIKNETDLGKEAQSYVNSGELVPDYLIMKIIEERIKEKDCKKGFMFDGFPRTIQQAEDLDLLFERLKYKIDQVFYFETSKKIIIERLSDRRVCTKCGAIYNLNYNPPKIKNQCDKCGGELIQRDDDKEETILKRLEVFNDETLPLVDYYQKQNILTKINADQDLDDRFKEVDARLKELGLI
jgi:adenylate kinase